MRWRLGALAAVLEVEGIGKEEFLIDTGGQGSIAGSLRKEAFEKLLAARGLRLAGVDKAIVMLTHEVSSRRGQVGRVALGPFKHQGLIFNESGSEVGTLELAYLSRFVVTFDVPRSAMYLRPGKEFNRPDYLNLSGLSFFPLDGKIWVFSVEQGSAAEAAGLRKFDEIVSVDGAPAASIPMIELYRRLAIPGPRRVVFEREIVRKDTTVVLRSPFEGYGKETRVYEAGR